MVSTSIPISAFHEPSVIPARYQTVQFTIFPRDGTVGAMASAPDSAVAPGSRRAGRPRSPALDRAILDAAVHLLSTQGYARMSMDAVAARAGVSKATIYLRYAGKADLATAAIAHLRETGRPEPTGDLRADLLAQLRSWDAGGHGSVNPFKWKA